ncbi:hypothetical protein QJS10_CPB04g00825 [Acorus calamus]|uniref:Translocator protein homolog n=1 Tax=Acorus calamus TaxID=4465 RepID=A0AAV9F5Y8_ACOCL|nr:hypothetical protein QJS10_CPB04g00825 [Acorus calamus]
MASQDLRQRSKDEPTTTATTTTNNRRAKKLAMARRGLKSLSIAVAVPFTLTLLTIYLSGSSSSIATAKPIWHPPIWAFHVASLSSSSIMGLSAWLVWAEGGFRRRPVMAGLYLAQLALGLLWGPVVFGLGAVRVGLGVCVGLFVALLGCAQGFREVNPIAGDLVKPCLAWVSFLALLNYKLV